MVVTPFAGSAKSETFYYRDWSHTSRMKWGGKTGIWIPDSGISATTTRVYHMRQKTPTATNSTVNAWARDAGLRIDHLLLRAPLAKRLQRAGVDRSELAAPHESDHARCGSSWPIAEHTLCARSDLAITDVWQKSE